jgi:hypothetical protein
LIASCNIFGLAGSVGNDFKKLAAKLCIKQKVGRKPMKA